MIRNFILDWSGTVVDDLAPTLDATNAVLRHHGVAELSREAFRDEFHLPYTSFYEARLPGVPIASLEEVYHSQFKRSDAPVHLLPGAREFLEACRAHRRRVFVLSSIHPDHFADHVDGFGLAGLVERAFTGVTDKAAFFPELVRETGIAPSESAYVGDMVHDIEAARAGGVTAVAVLSGYDGPLKLAAAAPDITLPDVAALGRVVFNHPPPAPEPVAGGADPAAGPAAADRPVVTVGALVRDDSGRVLLVRTHKWSDLWGIPGGKVNRGETSVGALARELREETGLEVDAIEQVLVQDCIDPPEFERRAHFLLLNYTAHAAGASPPVTLNDEAEEAVWVTPGEAAGYPLNAPTRRLLEHVGARRAGGHSPPAPEGDPDRITIEDLELPVHIGVTAEEREGTQVLRATITVVPRRRDGATAPGAGDDLANTVDYFDVSEAVRALAAERPRNLVETLAGEIADLVLARFAASAVTVTVRKQVLERCGPVAVTVTRHAGT